MSGKPDYSLRSLERALNILSFFAEKKTGLTLTEVSQKLEVNMSTTFRILSTLEKHGFIQKNEHGHKYFLGISVAKLCSEFMTAYPFKDIALPFMEQLQKEYHETVALYAIKSVKHNERVCIARVESDYSLRRVVNVGDSMPLTRSAAGNVLMAYLPEKDQRHLLSLEPLLSMEDLANIKQSGYAISDSSREIGIAGIAAPIFDASDHVAASLAITGPNTRLIFPHNDKIVTSIKETAHEITKAIDKYTPD